MIGMTAIVQFLTSNATWQFFDPETPRLLRHYSIDRIGMAKFMRLPEGHHHAYSIMQSLTNFKSGLKTTSKMA